MKKMTRVCAGICLAVFCMMALHCANPFAPRIVIVTPDQPVIIQDAAPYSLPVEVSVPVPGVGATVYPVDTATFQATLTRLLDGEVLSEDDVTTALGDPVLDPDGTNTWTGTVDLAGFGDYELGFTIGNDMGTGAKRHSFRLEQTVALLEAGYPIVTISKLGQAPKNCLIPNFLLGAITGLIGDLYFDFGPISGSQIPPVGSPGLAVDLDLPVLGAVQVVLNRDDANNDILMDGPDDYEIDLTGLAPIPGFDCVITGAADGAFDDTDPGDVDGYLTVSIISVEPSLGGTCSLNAPTGDCDMIVSLDTDP